MSMAFSAMDDYPVEVTAFGYKDIENDGFYGKGTNHWDNEFSNEFSLMQLSNGGIARVSECRRIGYKAPSSYISGFYGTEGSYQFSNAQHILLKKTASGVDMQNVSDYVNPCAMTAAKEQPEHMNKVANHTYQWNSFSPVQEQERARLPESYLANPQHNGHMASHQLLVDDFCTAVYHRTLPRVNAWVAARYTIPGLIAHQSALLGGVPLDIPDFGEPTEK
jgi:phage tail protein X